MKNNKKKDVTFLDLSAADSQGIGKIIFKNALRLKNDALILRKNSSFSSATSILILSLEEVIKAIFVDLHALGYPVYKLKNQESIFRNHTKRHQLAQIIEKIEGFTILVKIVEYAIKYRKNKENEQKSIDQNIINDRITNLCDFLNNLCSDSDIEKFNIYKNNGFYVDYVNELLVPDKIITDYEFSQVNRVHNQITKIYKLIVLSHHDSIKNRNNYADYLEIKMVIQEIVKTLKSENK
jgi:AbiV family abortive infection protein